MSRSEQQRFGNILIAIERCLQFAPYLDSSEFETMAYDDILRDLGVIGEAVRAIPEQTRATMPDVPWPAIAGLRNIVVHEYFRVNRDLVVDIIDNELTRLAESLRPRTQSR